MQPRSTVQTSERAHAFGPHAHTSRRRAPRKPELIGARVPGFQFDSDASTPIYYPRSAIGQLGCFKWYPRLHWPDSWSICADYAGAWHCNRAVVDDFGSLVVVPQ